MCCQLTSLHNRRSALKRINQIIVVRRIFSVSAAALRAGPLPIGQELPVKLVGKKSSQGIGLGASPFGGNIYFAPLTETAIAEFNPKTNEQRWVVSIPIGIKKKGR